MLSLKNKLQDNNIFNTFFQDSKLYDVKDDTAYISVKTKFAKELLECRYVDIIEMTLEEVSKSYFRCVITMENNQEIIRTSEIKPANEGFSSNLNGNYTFENFVVGPSNQEAQSAALTAATTGDIIYLPAGTYSENITINKSVTIKP